MTDSDNTLGSSPNAALPVNSDKLAQYTLTSPLEIAHHLRRIVLANQMVTVFSNQGKSFILSRILAVDSKQDLLIFDMGSNPDMNRLLLKSDRHVFVCTPEGVKTQFAVGRVREINYEGRAALATAIPIELIKLQRREYFRIQTPIASPISCHMHDFDGGKGLILPVYDISLGGVSLILPDDIPGVGVGMSSHDCSLDLKQSGTIPVEIEVRNKIAVRQKNGVSHTRVGCEFRHLSAKAENNIQRYISQLERERRALLRD